MNFILVATQVWAWGHQYSLATNSSTRERSIYSWKTNLFFFQSNTIIFYYLTCWRQVSVIWPSSGRLYIKF